MAKTNPVFIAEGSASSTATPVDVFEHGSVDIVTVTTADPGSGGTSLAVSDRSPFPQSGNFKIAVEDEVMEVTAGHGAGAGSWTSINRGVDGTTAVAHASGVTVAMIVGTQRVIPVSDRRILYKGRIMSFRIPGRAGTAGQKILSIHNATGSKVKVRVTKIIVDIAVTVVKAVTVLPPVIRVWKVTALPTNGTALTKVPQNSAMASSASVTVLNDASADGTNSASALTATLPAGTYYTEEFAPRLITAAGYEMFDREVFFAEDDDYIDLNALEGAVVFLDYTLATQNPITDMWLAGLEWEEFIWT